MKPKAGSLKTKKTDKPLAKLTTVKIEKPHITRIRNLKVYATNNLIKAKRITKKYMKNCTLPN